MFVGLEAVNVKPSPIMFQSDFLNYGALAYFAVIFVCLHFPGFLRSKEGKRQSSDLAHMTVTISVAG